MYTYHNVKADYICVFCENEKTVEFPCIDIDSCNLLSIAIEQYCLCGRLYIIKRASYDIK